MILLLAWQSAATCHAAHLAARQDASIGVLIASSLCSTAASPATGPPGAPLRTDSPITGDRAPTDDGSTGLGCLHCASGGCSGSARWLAGGWPVAALLVAAAAGPTAARGKSGASAWRNGHPVRGPPQSGV